MLGAEKIVQDTDHFEVKLFHLIACEDRVCVPLHARTHLAEGKDFGGLLRVDETRPQTQGSCDRKKSDVDKSTRFRQMIPGRKHEPIMIRGEVTGSNRTRGVSGLGP